MNVDEIRAQHRVVPTESQAEGYLLKSMEELDNASDDEAKRLQAERKVSVMGDAYQHIVDGNRHKHDAGRIVLNGVVAGVVGVVVATVSDSRIFPRAAEAAMRNVMKRV